MSNNNSTLLALKRKQVPRKEPSDPSATKRTRQLYHNLHLLRERGIMFGHQDDLAYGIGWNNVAGESDIKRVIGYYPAVYGWDLGHIELGDENNIDTVAFADMRRFIRQAYARGGVNTISWHLHNPQSGGSSWDTTAAVKYILRGGPHHEKYIQWLDKVADFLLSLKYRGKPIPVLFRPYHEHTGSWFWWGEKNCTADEYKALWRMTVEYLRDKRGVHNLLWVYSAAEFKDPAHFLERYPGDDIIDMIGFDSYMHQPLIPGSKLYYMTNIKKQLGYLHEVGLSRDKLICLAETGAETVPVSNWWTGVLYEAIKDFPISYVLIWRNDRLSHYYAPYPGQVSAEDFKIFAFQQNVLTERETRPAKLYHGRGFWVWFTKK